MGLLDTGVKKISGLLGMTTLGRKAAAAALGIVLSDEDLAKLEAIRALLAALPNPTGAATAANQATANTSLSAIDTKLGSSLPLPTGAATATKQDTGNTSLGAIDTKLASQATAANQSSQLTLVGAVTETAPASDTASSGLNGRLQRTAQRLTSLIALFPASIGQKAKAASLAVTLASDEDLLSRLPASLGAKTSAASFSITNASDEPTIASIGAAQSGPDKHRRVMSVLRRDTPTAPMSNDQYGMPIVDGNGRLWMIIGSTGATDDAAAAGSIFPLAGLYQSTVDEIDSGDLGRIQASRRRALVSVNDTRELVIDAAHQIRNTSWHSFQFHPTTHTELCSVIFLIEFGADPSDVALDVRACNLEVPTDLFYSEIAVLPAAVTNTHAWFGAIPGMTPVGSTVVVRNIPQFECWPASLYGILQIRTTGGSVAPTTGTFKVTALIIPK